MNEEFLTAIQDLERERGIRPDVLLEAIEAALISAYKRNFGSAQNVRVAIDRETGEFHVMARREVVEVPEDGRLEVSIDEARIDDPRAQVGDVREFEVTPRDFGRIAAQTAKQVVVQRIREAERGMVFEEFQNREGDIVTGTVHRVEHRTVYVELGKAEAILTHSEQIPGEVLVAGSRIKAYVLEVKRTSKGPQIMLSRSHPGLLRRLLELEVPELHDGAVELRGIAREAGFRSKVAVEARVAGVDPIGACVGPRRQRIDTIVSELRGEKIDLIRFSPELKEYIGAALQPARVTSVSLEEDGKIAHVIVPESQLSLAIGKEGQNARLAAKLTGWKIDIRADHS